MSFYLILLAFAVFRFFDLLIIFLAKSFIPYLGFFPYKELLPNFSLPTFISSLANFDGLHYLMIARNGYSQYEQAFFPLYPLLIRLLSPLFFNNPLLTGIIISNLCFLAGLYFLYRYLKLFNYGLRMTYWLFIFLLLFPTSFYFGAVYTEGLFFFLFTASLYFLKKENYPLASLFIFFASLTRLIGFFLIIPVIFSLIQKPKLKRLMIIFSPLAGLGIYCFYLWITTHDPLAFLHSQWAFGANRSSNLIFLPQVYFRYFKIFLTATPNFQYFISLFEFVTFNLFLVVLILDLIKNWKLKIKNFEVLGLIFFSFVNLLLPTLTGTFSSVPRYVLFSVSFFLFLPQIKSSFLKITLALIFLFFHIIMLGLFSQGYFVS